jgi:hypothetical protein
LILLFRLSSSSFLAGQSAFHRLGSVKQKYKQMKKKRTCHRNAPHRTCDIFYLLHQFFGQHGFVTHGCLIAAHQEKDEEMRDESLNHPAQKNKRTDFLSEKTNIKVLSPKMTKLCIPQRGSDVLPLLSSVHSNSTCLVHDTSKPTCTSVCFHLLAIQSTKIRISPACHSIVAGGLHARLT